MTLHVETFGAGTDLVLLHGWGMHGGVWGDFAAGLGESHRVHVIDLAGCGLSASMPGIAPDELISALLDQAPASAVWLGWSLGGTLAARLAAERPERVSGLVLLACNPCFVRRTDWPWGMEEAVFERFAAGVKEDGAAALPRFASLLCQGLEEPRPVLKTLRERLASRPAPDTEALLAGLDWLRDLDARPALARLQCPLLAVGGGRDALLPAAALEAAAALNPRGRFAVIPGASHVPFLSHREDTLAPVESFRWRSNN